VEAPAPGPVAGVARETEGALVREWAAVVAAEEIAEAVPVAAPAEEKAEDVGKAREEPADVLVQG